MDNLTMRFSSQWNKPTGGNQVDDLTTRFSAQFNTVRHDMLSDLTKSTDVAAPKMPAASGTMNVSSPRPFTTATTEPGRSKSLEGLPGKAPTPSPSGRQRAQTSQVAKRVQDQKRTDMRPQAPSQRTPIRDQPRFKARPIAKEPRLPRQKPTIAPSPSMMEDIKSAPGKVKGWVNDTLIPDAKDLMGIKEKTAPLPTIDHRGRPELGQEQPQAPAPEGQREPPIQAELVKPEGPKQPVSPEAFRQRQKIEREQHRQTEIGHQKKHASKQGNKNMMRAFTKPRGFGDRFLQGMQQNANHGFKERQAGREIDLRERQAADLEDYKQSRVEWDEHQANQPAEGQESPQQGGYTPEEMKHFRKLGFDDKAIQGMYDQEQSQGQYRDEPEEPQQAAPQTQQGRNKPPATMEEVAAGIRNSGPQEARQAEEPAKPQTLAEKAGLEHDPELSEHDDMFNVMLPDKATEFKNKMAQSWAEYQKTGDENLVTNMAGMSRQLKLHGYEHDLPHTKDGIRDARADIESREQDKGLAKQWLQLKRDEQRGNTDKFNQQSLSAIAKHFDAKGINIENSVFNSVKEGRQKWVDKQIQDYQKNELLSQDRDPRKTMSRKAANEKMSKIKYLFGEKGLDFDSVMNQARPPEQRQETQPQPESPTQPAPEPEPLPVAAGTMDHPAHFNDEQKQGSTELRDKMVQQSTQDPEPEEDQLDEPVQRQTREEMAEPVGDDFDEAFSDMPDPETDEMLAWKGHKNQGTSRLDRAIIDHVGDDAILGKILSKEVAARIKDGDPGDTRNQALRALIGNTAGSTNKQVGEFIRAVRRSNDPASPNPAVGVKGLDQIIETYKNDRATYADAFTGGHTLGTSGDDEQAIIDEIKKGITKPRTLSSWVESTIQEMGGWDRIDSILDHYYGDKPAGGDETTPFSVFSAALARATTAKDFGRPYNRAIIKRFSIVTDTMRFEARFRGHWELKSEASGLSQHSISRYGVGDEQGDLFGRMVRGPAVKPKNRNWRNMQTTRQEGHAYNRAPQGGSYDQSTGKFRKGGTLISKPKVSPGQKSLGFKEEDHPRETDAHDTKRPGEFAPKKESKPIKKEMTGQGLFELSYDEESGDFNHPPKIKKLMGKPLTTENEDAKSRTDQEHGTGIDEGQRPEQIPSSDPQGDGIRRDDQETTSRDDQGNVDPQGDSGQGEGRELQQLNEIAVESGLEPADPWDTDTKEEPKSLKLDIKKAIKDIQKSTDKMDKMRANYKVGSSRARATSHHAKMGNEAKRRDDMTSALTHELRERIRASEEVPKEYLDAVGKQIDYNQKGDYDPVGETKSDYESELSELNKTATDAGLEPAEPEPQKLQAPQQAEDKPFQKQEAPKEDKPYGRNPYKEGLMEYGEKDKAGFVKEFRSRKSEFNRATVKPGDLVHWEQSPKSGMKVIRVNKNTVTVEMGGGRDTIRHDEYTQPQHHEKKVSELVSEIDAFNEGGGIDAFNAAKKRRPEKAKTANLEAMLTPEGLQQVKEADTRQLGNIVEQLTKSGHDRKVLRTAITDYRKAQGVEETEKDDSRIEVAINSSVPTADEIKHALDNVEKSQWGWKPNDPSTGEPAKYGYHESKNSAVNKFINEHRRHLIRKSNEESGEKNSATGVRGNFRSWLKSHGTTENKLMGIDPKAAKKKQQEAISGASMSMKEYTDFHRKLDAGKVTADELKQAYAKFQDSKEGIRAELSKMKKSDVSDYTHHEGMVSFSDRGGTKAQIIESKLDDMQDEFNKQESANTWNMMDDRGAKRDNEVAATTDEHLKSHAAKHAEDTAKRAKDRADRQERHDNPQTAQDWQDKARSVGGWHKLETRQQASYDESMAEYRRSREAGQQQDSWELRGLDGGAETAGATSIVPGHHTKRDAPTFTVTVENMLGKDKFKEMVSAARRMGGNYTNARTAKAYDATAGFQFFDEETAQQFDKLLNGEKVDIGDKAREAIEAKRDRQNESLKDMSERLWDRSKAKLDAPRKDNTARRARMAASSESDARSGIARARTIDALVEHLESGDSVHLNKLKTNSQIGELESAMRMGNYSMMRAARKEDPRMSWSDREKLDAREPDHESITHTEYPYPNLYKRDLLNAKGELSEIPGLKMFSKKLGKWAKELDDDSARQIMNSRDLEAIDKAIPRMLRSSPRVKAIGSRMKDQMESLKRLRSMDIRTTSELRAALREYQSVKVPAEGPDKVKEAIRTLKRGKDKGFFPTPKTLINEMLDNAGIEEGQTILEPSAGVGDIVDMVKERHPDNPIHAIEQNMSIGEVMGMKGHDYESGDFLEHNKKYDRIIMNPPFENRQDEKHLKHAFDLLNPGGRIVAITGAGAHSNQRSAKFQEWLSDIGAEVYDNPEGSFNTDESTKKTGVNTKMVIIDKPESEKYAADHALSDRFRFAMVGHESGLTV